MKTNITLKLVFNRKNHLNKKGKSFIQIEAYKSGKRKFISTGISVEPEEWDSKKSIINKKNPNFTTLNLLIAKQIDALQKLIYNKLVNNLDVELDDLDFVENIEKNFYLIFEKYYTELNVSYSRKNTIQRTINYLKEFDNKLRFNNFDYKKISEFDYYLRINKNLHQNSIANLHKVVQAFFNYCVKSDIVDKNPYFNFKINIEKTEKDFLTSEQVEIIEKLDSSFNSHIDNVKDMFLFSCYTGLRFSDVQNLKSDNFYINKNEVFLKFKQQKTKDIQYNIPLHLLFDGKAIIILKKYLKENDFIFVQMSNQEVNRVLKNIQILAKINKTLTFHLSRHTFGTLLAKYTNDPLLIKDLMGHSKMDTSMIYIHLNNEMRNNKLKNIDWNK